MGIDGSSGLLDERLGNGLRVVVDADPTAPIAAVNVWYRVGSGHERPGRTGFAHLFEHLMFEGSTHVGKGEHFRLVNGAGGSLNGTTWCDRTNYFETVPSHHLELALWLEADRMGGLLDALDQARLDNQRSVVQNERRQGIDNAPYGAVNELLHEGAWPVGHPYHHSTIGSMADLDAATLDDAVEFFDTFYAPNNAVLSVVGDVDPVAVLEAADRLFGGIAPSRALPPQPAGMLTEGTGNPLIELTDAVPAVRVYRAYRCPPFGSQDYLAVELLAMVLGSGGHRGGRLARRLMHEREVAQRADASVWGLVAGSGLLLVDVTGAAGVTAETLEPHVDDCVTSLVTVPVDEKELDRAKALLSHALLHRLGGVDGRADLLSQHATLLGDPALVHDLVPATARVTTDDLARVVADTLTEDNRVGIVVSPRERR